MKWRNPIPWLKEFWHRDAGPMNWKNPIHVFALVGWQMFQTVALLVSICWRGLRFFAGLPPLLLFFFGGLWYAVWHFVRRPFPALDENPLLDLMDYHTPTFYGWVVLWYYAAPFVTVMLAGFLLMSVWKVWFESRRKRDFAAFGGLPDWPLSADQKAPGIVIGEVHHPVQAREIFNPSWLTIPERGLYTGVAIFGAVGSGKTSACMNPFARQLLGWQAANPQMRAAALVLEVKGDFCYDIRQILVEAGREKDYIELGMEGRWQWNPLSAWWLDSYSLAYTVSSLLNQLFGKGKEPFWQQAYTNLVRWIIELHRVFPERWVTLQQVYRCAIDPELFAAKIEEAEKLSDDLSKGTVFVSKDVIAAQPMNLGEWVWEVAADPQKKQAAYTRPMKAKLDELGIDHRIVWESGPGEEMRERVEAVKRWFVHDWQALDNKVKSSIVEGVSVFLAMFDMPDVAKVFCPKAPKESDDPQAIEAQAQILRMKKAKEEAAAKALRDAEMFGVPKHFLKSWTDKKPDGEAGESQPLKPNGEAGAGQPLTSTIASAKEETLMGAAHLPPIYELIEGGRVLALNMPAGINPALSRAVGVMLKNAWLQALLMRPAKMKAKPSRYFRPAVFICDEYQAFASVGEDDPSGDEKSFALTRQCRCIPIVATQSISSLRAVLGSSEAWRALLQTLRTRIFLSLSDDASAKIASELCGQVAKIRGSYTISETSKRAEVSPLSGRAGGGGGSIGATKSFREQREAVFHPRDFTLLSNCQAICLPYDGAQSLEPRRVYLKPHYLPAEHSYWRAKEAGRI